METNGFDYPCLCLCRGFSQITRNTPFRLIILHLLHIFFTEARTFIGSKTSDLLKRLFFSAKTLFHKTFIMSCQHMRFDLLSGIHGHAHYDQKGSAPEVKWKPKFETQKIR